MGEDEFSGERFLPDKFSAEEEIAKFHKERYVFAERVTRGKIVLDVACGEGYGSDMLAAAAAQVYGVDNDPRSIASARNKYHKNNLFFSVGSATELGFKDDFFDTVVSFETIEHLSREAQTQFLSEIRRILKKGGAALISSPDKDIYGWGQNPFHLHELNKKEFLSLLSKFFQINSLYAQDVRASKSFLVRLIRQAVDTIRHGEMWRLLKKLIPKYLRTKVDVSTRGYGGTAERSSPDVYLPRQIKEGQSGTYILVLCRK